jgi:hypothetical protein
VVRRRQPASSAAAAYHQPGVRRSSFNDPKRERLHAWQHVAFAILALCGWALAGFVVAAFSGLIQS